ncbi:Ig-like domain repeat protein [Streptomyces sioyaensis]|uniref:Ig-like domain-containing protein n=1 Tax=Streptomyces sioyaensis TaxID=67364 RepID=UPI0036E4FC8C
MRFIRVLQSMLIAMVLVTGLALVPTVQAATGARPGGAPTPHRSADSGPAVRHDTSPPVRSLHTARLDSAPRKAKPTLQLPRPLATAKGADPAAQRKPGSRTAVPTTVNFDGIPGTGSAAPPDPNAAVGSTQVVEVVNTRFAVYSKTGSPILNPQPTNTLWKTFGGACETTNNGDAVVRWDTLANRWIITQLAIANATAGPYFQCVAVSQTADATGSYNRYAFQYSAFNDFPKLSVWRDAYYVTYNMFTEATAVGAFLGPQTCALERESMLNGSAADQQCYQLSPTSFALLGSDLDGSTPPPPGEPELVIGLNPFNNHSLGYSKFHVDWDNPANTTYSAPAPLIVDNWVVPPAAVPQGGTSQTLDGVRGLLMYRLAYRNLGGGVESLVASHSAGGTVGNTGERWYELRLDSAGNPTVRQQGTYAPDDTSRWVGSIAQDKAGGIALGYSQSSSTTNPSIRFTGRLADDPLGTMTLGETTVITGGGTQTGERWGDYTSMAVDPSNDCTFWYTNQYQETTGYGNWHTRLAAFTLPNCGVSTTTTLASSPPSSTVFGQPKTFTATVAPAPPATGTPTGTVTFFISGIAQPPVPLVGGVATLTTSSLPTGTRTVRATYNGSTNFNNSTSNAINATVSKAGTATALASSQNPSTHGHPVTFTATTTAAAPGSGTPTGTVTFFISGIAQPPVPLVGGVATLTTSSLPTGTRTVRATYNGSTNFNNSTSNAINQSVAS